MLTTGTAEPADTTGWDVRDDPSRSADGGAHPPMSRSALRGSVRERGMSQQVKYVGRAALSFSCQEAEFQRATFTDMKVLLVEDDVQLTEILRQGFAAQVVLMPCSANP